MINKESLTFCGRLTCCSHFLYHHNQGWGTYTTTNQVVHHIKTNPLSLTGNELAYCPSTCPLYSISFTICILSKHHE